MEEIRKSLHDHEKAVLLALKKGESNEKKLSEKTGLSPDAIARACLQLEAKSLVSKKEETKNFIELSEEGKEYAKKGLPERQTLELINKGKNSVEQINNELGPKAKIAITQLMRKQWAEIKNGQIKLTEKGRKKLQNKTVEEQFIEKLSKQEKTTLREKPEFVKQRKELYELTTETNRTYSLNKKGKEIAESGLKIEETINVLTSKMIKTGKWKKAKFREYNIKAEVPSTRIGKKQPYLELLDEAREYLASLGFEELRYSVIETEFWNFDALYQPQFHPARTKKDTYYIKEPKKAGIPKEYAEKIKQTHENGWKTGSTGWKYKWDQEQAKNLLMRTHTTASTVKAMKKSEQIPSKYFTISRNFRRDVIDATHLPEFFQCDGIIIQENMTFRELLGALKEFALVFAGTDKVKFKPAYFPYTEPSVELFAKHPQIGNIELGGAGMFRPEVRLPAGIKEEVMAWGLGFDRLCMLKLGLKDIRELFSHDLKWLEESPMRMM